jgi:hypothetical protein
MEFDLDTRLVYLGIPELGEEIHMPHLAAEFAIGRDLQAHVLLQLDGVANGIVLEVAQGFPGHFTFLVLLPRLHQCGWAQ